MDKKKIILVAAVVLIAVIFCVTVIGRQKKTEPVKTYEPPKIVEQVTDDVPLEEEPLDTQAQAVPASEIKKEDILGTWENTMGTQLEIKQKSVVFSYTSLEGETRTQKMKYKLKDNVMKLEGEKSSYEWTVAWTDDDRLKIDEAIYERMVIEPELSAPVNVEENPQENAQENAQGKTQESGEAGEKTGGENRSENRGENRGGEATRGESVGD